MPDTRRFLVVLPNWFGETLFVTPFLQALRAAHPEALIAALGVARCEEVLAQSPHLDEFLLYDDQRIHRTFRGKRALIALIRSRGFTAAFILRKSLTRTVMLVAAGIPRRIGFDNPKSGWLLTDRVRMPAEPMHKAHGYLRLLAPLGIAADHRLRCRFDLSPQEQEAAARRFQEHGVPGDRPVVVLHPGANWPHKRWSPERFAEVGDRLARESGCAILITGGPDDGSLVEAIRRRMANAPLVLAGETTLRELAACLERAQLIVSNDTGVLHIACALGRPAVALYGPTSPAFTGPLGDPARTTVIHHPDCCPHIPCYRPEHPSHPGMDAISVDEVYAAARRYLTA